MKQMERKVSESSLDSSKKLRSKTHTDKGEDLLDDDGPSESDEFYKKWSGPVLLGPFLVAIFAALIIVSGQLVLNTSTGTCGYNLECKCHGISFSKKLYTSLTTVPLSCGHC